MRKSNLVLFIVVAVMVAIIGIVGIASVQNPAPTMDPLDRKAIGWIASLCIIGSPVIVWLGLALCVEEG